MRNYSAYHGYRPVERVCPTRLTENRAMVSWMKAPERHVLHSNRVVVIDCEQENTDSGL
jgi:hypothetical protein